MPQTLKLNKEKQKKISVLWRKKFGKIESKTSGILNLIKILTKKAKNKALQNQAPIL